MVNQLQRLGYRGMFVESIRLPYGRNQLAGKSCIDPSVQSPRGLLSVRNYLDIYNRPASLIDKSLPFQTWNEDKRIANRQALQTVLQLK